MPEPRSALTPGDVLSGRYRLESHLGAGATSSVWRARDLELGRVVALKALLGTGVDPQLAARFEREGTILGRLSHPNLVPVFASGTDGGRPYLVMELVDGKPFDRILADGPLPVDDALEVLADVAAGLGAAHRAGVVHRDVKPANIVCGSDGTPRVVDFGIAGAGDLTTMTNPNSVVGTAAYLAPEQARGHVLGPPTDVYALGCVLYHALTGRPPFVGDSALAVAYRQVHDAPDDPRTLRAEIPVAVSAVVLRALAKDPGERHAGGAELEADLRRLLAGEDPALAPVLATTGMAAVGAGATDTMPLPAVDTMSEELIDPSPLAARASSGARRWGIAAAAAGGVVLIGLVLAGVGDGDDPERPAGANDDPPITTTVPTTEAPPTETSPDDEKDGKDDGKGNGKGKGKKGDD